METTRTKEQQELYDSDLKAKSDYYGSISYAALEAAADTSKLIAEKMKLKRMSTAEIVELTNLSSEEIEKL